MFRQYRKIEKGELILVGADTSSGGLDYSSAQFLSKTKLDVPLVYHSRKTTSYMTDELVPVLEKVFDVTGIKPTIAYETNNGGSFELERLARLNRNGKFSIWLQPTRVGTVDQSEPKKYGWTTSSATRPVMLQDLKEAVDNSLVRIYDNATINEMYSFIINQTSTSWKAQAESGAHDDLVMSLAIAWQLYQDPNLEVLSESQWNKAIEELPNETLFRKGGFY